MRLHFVSISKFKGVEIHLAWSPLIVLTGPNGSGKTNVIEALDQLFAGRGDAPVREDVAFASGALSYLEPDVLIELPGRDERGHPDRRVLEGALRWGESWLSPGDPDGLPVGVEIVQEVSPSGFAVRSSDLDDQIMELRAALAPTVSDLTDSSSAVAFDLLAAACLRSRWLGYNGMLQWLGPEVSELTDEELAAARVVARQPLEEFAQSLEDFGESLIYGVWHVGRGLCGESTDRRPFLDLGSDQGSWITPFRVVRISSTQRAIADLEIAVQRRVARKMRSAQMFTPVGDDPWFEQDNDGREHVSQDARNLCAEVGRVATSLASNFISSRYAILVTALEPSLWELNGGRRVRVSLQSHDDPGNGDFGLGVAGSGISLWSSYAVEQALDEVTVSSRSSPHTLYLIDEPERHLHPTAQVEAARFIEQLVHSGADVVVATHAAPFINASSRNKTLALVRRQRNVTTSADISMDALRHLATDLDGAGLTVAELLQLIRGVLLVEGPHDRLVVERLCGKQLGACQVRVMILRGAHETLSLLDADLLRGLEKPIRVMLDSTRPEALRSIKTNQRLPKGATNTEQQLHTLMKRAPELVRPIAFDAPDIIVGLPEEAIRFRYPQFPGWRVILAEAAKDADEPRAGATNAVKTTVARKLGVNIDQKWIEGIVDVALALGMRPEPVLQRAVSEALASMDGTHSQTN